MHLPRHPLFLIASFLLALSLALPALAADQRVATIIVTGLRHIEREQLLDDLLLHEGDPFVPDLLRKLEYRARRLPYLKSFRVESRAGSRGAHLTMHVREASRIRIHPFFMVQEDGELNGGFHIDGDALLGLGEHWHGVFLGGTRTEGRVILEDLRCGPAWLPGLNFDLGLRDWEQPFWNCEARHGWALVGPSCRLPGGGSLLLLGGLETIETSPPSGVDPEGEDKYGLIRAEWRQPLRPDELQLKLRSELRTREQERGFARGVLSLDAHREQERIELEAILAAGLASHSSPVQGLHYLDSWTYLRAYEAGSLPAREFHFLRLRADLRLFSMPVRLRRRAPEEFIVYGVYLLAEGARLRLTRSESFRDAYDWGLGISLRLPTRLPSRASFGIQWKRDGEPRSIFLLEER